MSEFVLDCSVTMSWCFGDEATVYGDSVLEGLADTGAIAPSIWPLEVSGYRTGDLAKCFPCVR